MEPNTDHSSSEEEVDSASNAASGKRRVEIEEGSSEEDIAFSESYGESSNDDGTDHNDGSEDSDNFSAGEEDEHQPSLKRQAGDAAGFRPFKRQKGVLNHEYLDLLNREIEDAAHRVCLEDEIDLASSQVGLTIWSSLEKRQFFEALGRLGRHDLPAIASRIGSKSALEVRHYINFLQNAHSLRRKLDRRSLIEPAEYQAAVELSQQSCHAQEEAADAISVKQELREQQREEIKWDKCWDITPRLAKEMDMAHTDTGGNQPPFSRLFHLSRWLELSYRAFMNSSIPGSNWNNIDDKLPSMWATTFEDFHSLAVSITRRLVQTTLFISMSRIKAKSEMAPGTRQTVRRRDVEAAIASLGMSPNAQETWKKAARRLRLDVYNIPPGHHDDVDEEPMDYDEVETLLSAKKLPKIIPTGLSETMKQEMTSADEEEFDEEEDVADEDSLTTSEDEDDPAQSKEEAEINREAKEILWYSAANVRDVQAARRALKLRITTERRQEEEATAHDEHASYLAEAEMWSLLKKKPPHEMPKKQDPGQPSRSTMDVESIYPIERDWGRKLEYYSEWETSAAQEEE